MAIYFFSSHGFAMRVTQTNIHQATGFSGWSTGGRLMTSAKKGV